MDISDSVLGSAHCLGLVRPLNLNDTTAMDISDSVLGSVHCLGLVRPTSLIRFLALPIVLVSFARSTLSGLSRTNPFDSNFSPTFFPSLLPLFLFVFGHSGLPFLPPSSSDYHVTMMDYVAWRCLASTSLVVVMVSYYVLAECFQLYKTIWADSERTLRPLSGPASFHCGSFSPRPGWLSCACALHFLAPRTVSLGCPSFHLLFTNSLPLYHVYIPCSDLPSFLHATSSRVYTQWHLALSPKPSRWPLVTGIYPIPSAGSVSDVSCMRLSTLNYPQV